MLLAVGLLAATASLCAYNYLSTKRSLDGRISLKQKDVSSSQDTKEIEEGTQVAGPQLVVEDANAETKSPERLKSFQTTKHQVDDEMLPPPEAPNGALKSPPKNQLMPPPPRPKPSVPKPSSSLRPPPSAASTLRAPPAHKPSPNSAFAPSASTLPPESRPSRKILLAPGHSPLDWAALTRSPPFQTFLRGGDVPPERLIRVTPSMLKKHNGRRGNTPWGVFGGKVYHLGPYADFHPGGVPQLMKAAGNTEGERLFREVHPWVSWENMLGECCVGILVSEEEGEGKGAEEMDEMD